MSPKKNLNGPDRIALSKNTPLQVIHVVGNFMRIWSIYSVYYYLGESDASVTSFMLACLVPSSIAFLLLQRPWKGRPLSNSQVIPALVNGGITALYFILWGKGLKSCGPLISILAEYSGASLGVISAAMYGWRRHIWRKVGGLLAMVASFYLLCRGWAMSKHRILYGSDSNAMAQRKFLGISDMAAPLSAGILSALRRVVSRRVSLKNQVKRRLYAITIAAATCFLFPVAMLDAGPDIAGTKRLPFVLWPFSSFTIFGVILIFYVENIAEERLHIVFSSPRHLAMAGGCIFTMELIDKNDLSLVGFFVCLAVLGFGIKEATSLAGVKKATRDLTDDTLDSHMEMPLPS